MPVAASVAPGPRSRPSVPAWRVPGAVTMLLSVFLGRLPQAMGVLALVRLVRDQQGTYGLAGLATAAFVLGSALGQPVLGRWVERSGTLVVLPATAATGTLGLLGAVVAGVSTPVGLVAGAALAGVATPPLESTLRSLWPRTMHPGPQLNAAFGMDLAAQELLYVLGPLLASAGILALGPAGTMVVMAGLLLVGTLAFAVHPVPRGLARSERRAGTRSPLSTPALRWLAVLVFLIGLPVGSVAVLVSAWAEIHAQDGAAGLLMAVNGLGGFLGTVWISRWPFRSRMTPALRGIVLGFAVLFLALAATGLPLLWYCGAAALAGVGFPMALTQVFHLVARVVPAEVSNEANAWVVTAVNIGIAAGTWASGAVVGALGPGAGSTATVLLAAASAALSALVVPRGLAHRVQD